MSLPPEVSLILDMLSANGFSAHVVGGAVRDSLIGRELGDFDVTTDASPEQTKAVFSDYKTVDTGIKHGTVTVVINHTPYEITTYRIDGDYKDKRHPDTVTFTKELSEDLKRRDFTVNAMAYNPNDGLVDLYGGAQDADDGIIRAVGDPRVRFSEDALRILRALRFASVLNFEIEKNTADAARELKESLSDVSAERIYAELKKLICGAAASRIMTDYSDIIAPALGVNVEKYPSDGELLSIDYLTRLSAVFLFNSEAPLNDASRALSALKTDNLTRIYVENVLKGYNSPDFKDRRSILHSLANLGFETLEGILKLGLLDGRFSSQDKNLFYEVISENPVYTLSGLNVGGHDLISLGYKGREVGEMLNKLLFAVIDGECENTRESLLKYLAK